MEKQGECCPPFEVEPWDGKTLEWNDKKFIRDKVRTFFYMPIGFGRTMRRMVKRLEEAGAESPDWLCLSDHTSRWNMDVYLAVDRHVPGAEMCDLSGSFLSKVYEGPFSDTGKWCAAFSEHAKREGVEVEKLYMWYTTCPKCAKARGKNYVAILGALKTPSEQTTAES